MDKYIEPLTDEEIDSLAGMHIADIFMSLEKPKEWAEANKRLAYAIQDELPKVLADKGWDKIPTESELKQAWKAAKIKHASQYDQSILVAFGISIDEFIDLLGTQKSRKVGGRTERKETPKQKVIAALAFHYAHKNKMTSAKAVELAGKEITALGFSKPVSSKTISVWLGDLHALVTTDITLDPRGKRKV